MPGQKKLNRDRKAVGPKAQATPHGEAANNGATALAVGRNWLIAGAVLLLTAFVWAYWPTLNDIIGQWIHQPDYSHGFLVVPLALLFLWSRREQFPRGALHPSAWGVAILFVACVLRIAAGAFYLGPLEG